jgi:hypothetical protein
MHSFESPSPFRSANFTQPVTVFKPIMHPVRVGFSPLTASNFCCKSKVISAEEIVEGYFLMILAGI